MITKQRTLFYFVGDQAFKSLEEAQKADLIALIPPNLFASDVAGIHAENLACWMLENSAAIVDTLTTTPKSRLRARKIHGGTRKSRQPKAPPIAA